MSFNMWLLILGVVFGIAYFAKRTLAALALRYRAPVLGRLTGSNPTALSLPRGGGRAISLESPKTLSISYCNINI
jgi:hypothetical protein